MLSQQKSYKVFRQVGSGDTLRSYENSAIYFFNMVNHLCGIGQGVRVRS